MVGVLELREGKGRRPEVSRRRLVGLGCLWAEVPVRSGMTAGRTRRRVDKGAALLAQAGVRRVLTAAGFPWWDVLGARGLRPVEPERFCQALAVPLALAALARQGVAPQRAGVLLSGPRVSRPLLSAAEALCPQVRRLSLDVPGEGEALAAWLWREYGAAMVSPGAGKAADVTIRFGPGERSEGVLLGLYGSRPDLAGFVPKPEKGLLPPQLELLPALALLWEEGRLDVGALKISSI